MLSLKITMGKEGVFNKLKLHSIFLEKIYSL